MSYQFQESDHTEFVEIDPTGRYGRYNEILGKGASKTVYKAFDEYEGIEVAWNQVKLYDFLQSPEELERLYCEIHLLKTLKHKNIMKFYTSWVDTSKRNINFVTEMFTSGTLRQYRQKHKRVHIRAVKHWCRQILKGLLYLHSHDPPIIHRDLKCDNIFINGNQGQVKIGDLGLAAILRKSHAAHCVGTPEFMAPEIYEEQYNELVDIYSFGMCILEMVTFEYPYSECTHPAQIYKKVTSGMKPDALYKVQDPEVKRFVEKCLATVSRRLPAKELLKDPFLQIDDSGLCSREDDSSEMELLARQSSFSPSNTKSHLMTDWFSTDLPSEAENEWDYDDIDTEPQGIDLFGSPEHDDTFSNVDITIKGRRREDGVIFLKLRIADKEGRIRNIYFPFDIEADTALSVATEMVAELDITDYDVTSIAEMIDGEISSLVPDWKPEPGIEETLGIRTPRVCPSCASNDSSCTSLTDFPSANNLACNNVPGAHCSRVGCSAATHGRFEEVTYQIDGSVQHALEEKPVMSSQMDRIDTCSLAARKGHTRAGSEILNSVSRNDTKSHGHHRSKSSSRKSFSQIYSGSIHEQSLDLLEVGFQHPPPAISDDYKNDIKQELKSLKAKHRMELADYWSQHAEEIKRPSSPSLENGEHTADSGTTDSLLPISWHHSSNELLKSLHFGQRLSHLSCDDAEPGSSTTRSLVNIDIGMYTCGNAGFERIRNGEKNAQYIPESLFPAKSFYTGILLPGYLPQANSVPVDAVDT